MNIGDLKANYTLCHKLEPWLHGETDTKVTDMMEVTGLYEWAAYPDSNETTAFVTCGTLTYVTMFRKAGTLIGMEAYRVREGTMLANMELWTKRFKPTIKRLVKSGVTLASDIAEQAFASEAQMRWFLDGYYQGAELYTKDGTEHVRITRS